ncbi:MAG: hypothetical protein LUF32_06380, partial [Clostridiales bacterium]|nr:hypothetical protein [Clostridiales bacterium]
VNNYDVSNAYAGDEEYNNYGNVEASGDDIAAILQAETDRIVSAVSESETPLNIRSESADTSPASQGETGSSAKETLKRIVLEIAGSGSIELDGGTDAATVLELIQDNMKPVLMSILKSEIYEEGDLSYVY